jgi:enoyl-CoA hydratase
MTVHVDPPPHHDDNEVVTLDRPERRNALDHATLVELRAAVIGAPGRGARVLVLTGGGVNFCAGADLSTVEDDAFVALLRDTLETLRRVPIPVVAAIRGPALGAGTQLALACDLRLATSGATFGIPAGKLGLTVDHWTVQQLARQAGHSIARAMLVGAEVFDGARLAQSGFVHRLVGDDADVLGEALAWADSVSHLAPLTLAAHKAMLDAAEVAEEASDELAATRLAAWRSDDLAEGLAAFGERRRPIFRGR